MTDGDAPHPEGTSMSQHPLRPFDDKAELERELMDADHRFMEGTEVGHLRSDDEDQHVRPEDRQTPVGA